MIPQAIKEVELFVENGEVQSKYFSAVASFGVSVLQSGIYATKLFYEAKKDKRKQIPKIIVILLGGSKEFISYEKDEILDALTALKLAMYTHKKVDNKEEQDE